MLKININIICFLNKTSLLMASMFIMLNVICESKIVRTLIKYLKL